MAPKILNYDKLIAKFQRMSKIDIMPAIKPATRLVQTTAKTLAPVDTGFLKRSIFVRFEDLKMQGIVYTTTEYAPYMEFGTVNNRPHPFMIPALLYHKKDIKNLIKDYYKIELGKIAKL